MTGIGNTILKESVERSFSQQHWTEFSDSIQYSLRLLTNLAFRKSRLVPIYSQWSKELQLIVVLIFTLIENVEEVESANNLLREGRRDLLKEGAFFNRPYGSITDAVFENTSPEMVKAIQSVKNIFDPNNVLNPGTLCFKEASR